MKKAIFTLSLLCALCACSSDDERDMTYPQIQTEGYVAVPIDCQVFQRGSEIPFNYIFTDDTELGNYNIEIHNNFDHHTHGTTSVDCEMEDKKSPVNPWVFNKSYTIPSGQTKYIARINIPIPSDIDPGDYHFMVRVTDKATWQQIHAVAIKVQ